MARPKDAEPAESYERIVAAATELIDQEGAAKLSLRRVAERSGTSLGAVTYYFDNRGVLLEACLERTFNVISGLVVESAARIATGSPWQQEVDAFVRALFRTSRRQRQLIHTRLLTTLEGGAVPRRRLEQQLLPMLEKTAMVFSGSPTNVPLRLAANSVEVVVTRYALHTDEELQLISGCPDVATAIEHVESYLVRFCTAAFASAMA